MLDEQLTTWTVEDQGMFSRYFSSMQMRWRLVRSQFSFAESVGGSEAHKLSGCVPQATRAGSLQVLHSLLLPSSCTFCTFVLQPAHDASHSRSLVMCRLAGEPPQHTPVPLDSHLRI